MIQPINTLRGPAMGHRGHGPAPFHADALLAQAVAQAGIGTWACDLVDGAISWTHGVYHLFGLSPTDRLDRRDTVAFYEEESRATMERLRAEAVAHARPFTMEAQIVRPDGERRWMRLSADVIRDNGRTTRLFGLKQDITEERMRWDALRRLAEHDAVTGLANRTVYENRFLNARPGTTPLGALVLFDLDNFKQINDRFGHAAGDACLRVAGQRLAAGFADAALVARIGGDEFAVLTCADLPPLALERRVAQVLVDLARPIEWRGHRLSFGASAGIAPVDAPHVYDAEELFSIADGALYAAKTAGRGTMMTGHVARRNVRHTARA
jgi:diguanylate cyclase (GGDEF)-like protein/PAS domain S-box-containing protein